VKNWLKNCKLRNGLISGAYWLTLLTVLELLLHILAYGAPTGDFLMVLGFNVCIAGVAAILFSFLPGKIRLIGEILVTALVILFFASQTVYFLIFGTLYSVALVQQGGQALMNFWKETMLVIRENLPWVLGVLATGFLLWPFHKLRGSEKTDWSCRGILLAAAVAAQFLVMALTNCRTTLLMTGALFGGIAFFLISRGGWKRFVLGLLAAALVLAGSFKLSGEIYRWNEDRIISAVSAIHAGDADEPDDGLYSVTEDGEIVITTENPQGSLVSDMASLNGRTYIWKSALQAIRDNKALALWGTEYSGTVISVYNSFPVEHSHNSWMEVLLRAGIPGLLIALMFTLLSAVRAAELLLSSRTELWKKIIAMLTMCVMVSGFLEPYLFGGKAYYHVIDFIFLFCTGYLDFWCKEQKM
jgi:hypothetical protein